MAYCSACLIGKAAHPATGWSLCKLGMGLLERCWGYTNVQNAESVWTETISSKAGLDKTFCLW